MKRIVSVSLGSDKRNHTATIEILGETVQLERIGVNGDMNRAVELIQELDGKVDAFGLGGTDLYIVAGKHRYAFRDSKRIARAAVKSPILDGSGLKNTLERRVVEYLATEGGFDFKNKKVLMTAAVDRFGMAEALDEHGAEMVIGELMFALGLPLPIRSMKTLNIIARLVAPIVVQLPFTWLYPTGKKQEEITPKFTNYYQWADIIAGDWLFIRRYMPERLDGKIILTNTVTRADVEELKKRGVKTLITTTPEINGRSFGTNLMEALIVAMAGKSDLTPADYDQWLDRLEFRPRIERLGIVQQVAATVSKEEEIAHASLS